MKRWIATLLAALLCLVLPAQGGSAANVNQYYESSYRRGSADASPAPGQSFADGLRDWLGRLDLEASDYSAQAAWEGNLYAAAVRQSAGVTEVTIDDDFTLQFSDQALCLRTGGRTYALDYAEILPLLQFDTNAAQAWTEDAEWLKTVLLRCAQETILPSVDLVTNDAGLCVHIALDDLEVRERFCAFVDTLIAEGALERLCGRFGGVLRAAFPDEDMSVEAVIEAWRDARQSVAARPATMMLEADITMSGLPWMSREIACVGSLTFQGQAYDFDLAFSRGKNGASLQAEIRRSDYSRAKYATYSVSLDLHDDRLSGAFSLKDHYQDIRCELDAEYSQQNLIGSLSCKSDGDPLWMIFLSGWNDQDQQTISGSAEFTDQTLSDPESQNVANIRFNYGTHVYEADLCLPDLDVQASATVQSTYRCVRFRATPRNSYHIGYSADAWLFNWGENGARVLCEFGTFNNYGSSPLMKLSGYIGGERADVSLLLPRSGISSGLRWETAEDGFDAELTCLQMLNRYASGRPDSAPMRVYASQHGRDYSAGFSIQVDRAFVDADVDLSLKEPGIAEAFEARLATRSIFESESRPYTLSYKAGKWTLVYEDTTWALDKITDTPEKIVWRVTTSDMPGTIFLVNCTLDAVTQQLTCYVTASGKPFAWLVLTPVEKTLPVPMDLTNAQPLDIQAIRRILRSWGIYIW